MRRILVAGIFSWTWVLFGITPCTNAAEAATAPAAADAPASTAGAMLPPEDMLRVRDPFKRPDRVIGQEIPRTDLERYQTDSFKMVAVLTGPTRMRAMLLAPDGKTYMVFERMKIGTRSGVIRKITTESVQVRERIVNVLGQEENVDSEIKLLSDARAQASAEIGK